MINKLQFEISYATVTPHDPEWFPEKMIIEAYNERKALEIFKDKTNGYLIPYESIKIKEI